MITVGLVKELYYIAAILRQEYCIQINPVWDGLKVSKFLEVKITPDGWLNVWYQTEHIWREQVEGETSFFGIESCDAISRIVACIDNNNPNWVEYRHIE